MRRRDFLTQATLLGAATALRGQPVEGWALVPGILDRIQPPRFPDRDFEIRRYGASEDGKTDCRPAILKAIQDCHAAGGGRVVVPAGNWLCNGPIHLAANVNLYLAEGATIRFGTNAADYLPAVLVRWEGTRCHNYSPLIYARGQDNIAITGRGTLDGQASRFWGEWKRKQTPDQEALRQMGMDRAPLERRVFGAGHYLRPGMFQPYECRNLLIEGVTFKDSPFWTVHPVFCANVTVRGVRVLPGTTNDDGVDPDSCRDVLIEDCVFDTADDNIAIKAGRDQDAWDGPPCENIVVRRCNGIRSRANGYCVGSEMSGSVRNVFIENNKVGDVQSALYVKSNSDRGGAVENIWMRSNTVETCDWFIKIETDYKGVAGHPYPSAYRNFHFENLTCKTARECGIYSVGIAAKPVSGIWFKDITVEKTATPSTIVNTRDLEMRNVRMNGKLLA
jgi:polygalacturonase